ncbi:MAG: class II fructose-bisphosphatase [Chloroflexota bacterium]
MTEASVARTPSPHSPSGDLPDHHLGLDMMRVTEAAALAAAHWMGRGDKEAADGAAVDAMRLLLNSVPMDGVIVIGEGEKDKAPMLYNGERLGNGTGPNMDVAVDPLEGTRLLALGQPNAISVIALAPRGTMMDPGPAFYMDKIVVGSAARGVIDITAPVPNNLAAISHAVGKPINEITVVVLDRPRNVPIIEAARAAGARIRLIGDGDVAGALMAVLPQGHIDVLMGIGGVPEGIIAACALLCVGGEMQARLAPQSEHERERIAETGIDSATVYTTTDLVRSNDVFFAATGVTDGELLPGVQYQADGATTTSLVLRGKSGTVRRTEATHRWERLMQFSSIPYHIMNGGPA